ncbi:MAG: hypothetical protein IIC70_08375, partial [Acidobacteria bacterium]|nr:hypothetical protein [Acidobacteriota bacterium]
MAKDEIQVYDHTTDLTVLPNATEMRDKLDAIREFQKLCKAILVDGHDYGIIPGTNKPTMLKPGAEKIAKLLKLSDSYAVMDSVQDWDKGLFHYTIRCELRDIATCLLVSSGIGECNSKESKYRWRWIWPDDVEPLGLDKATLVSRKTKNGGKQYRIENDDPFSLVNTILKMAKKRALVDAALSAGRLSEVFTQDTEDGERQEAHGGGEAEPTPSTGTSQHYCAKHETVFF